MHKAVIPREKDMSPKIRVLEGESLTLKEIKLICGKERKVARIFINDIPQECVLHVCDGKVKCDFKNLLNRKVTKEFLKSVNKIEFLS